MESLTAKLPTVLPLPRQERLPVLPAASHLSPAQGLRVFISAGAFGIGRAIADMLIRHGAKVHMRRVAGLPERL
jgi:hypothetical protein